MLSCKTGLNWSWELKLLGLCQVFVNAKYICILSAGWGAKSIGTNLCHFYASFPFSNCGRISSVGSALDYRVGGRGFDSRELTNTQGS